MEFSGLFSVVMKIAIFLLCLLSVQPQSRALPQSDDLAIKSQQAKQLMAEGNFVRAVPLYRELNQAVPNNAGLKLNLGIALHMAGKKREAIPELEAAVKLDATLEPAWLFLGTTRLQLGEPTAALRPLKMALSLEPDQPQARQMLAGALLSLGRPDEAAAEYRKLTVADPENAQGWYGLGRSYESLSGRSFDDLQKTAPQSAYLLSLLAETRLREQQLSSAFFLYRRALEQMPTLRGLHTGVAQIYRQTGHPDWAETEDRKESQLPAPDCHIEKLECQFNAGEFDELTVAAKQPNAESFYWQSRAYNELALQAFAKLGQLPPSPELHELKAHIYNSQKKYSEAASEWREALKLSPTDTQIKKDLAISLKLGQDYEAALPLLQALLREQPTSAELNFLVGDTLLDRERADEALPLLQRAVTRDPKSLAAHKSLARAELAAGKPVQAIPHLKLALPTDEDGTLHYQLAQAYRASGQTELAKKALQEYEQIQRSAAAARESAKQETVITPP
jgi:predicted Zn-dependent protease